MRVSKKRKEALAMVDLKRTYSLTEAIELVKKMTYTKFDASVDIDMRLGVDPRKANEAIRGVVSLPHGTGKSVRVLALPNMNKKRKMQELTTQDLMSLLRR